MPPEWELEFFEYQQESKKGKQEGLNFGSKGENSRAGEGQNQKRTGQKMGKGKRGKRARNKAKTTKARKRN